MTDRPKDERATRALDSEDEQSAPARPSLDELTFPERVLVAAVQDPIRGLVVVLLSLFAISFLIALAFVYPFVALGFFLFLAFVVLAVLGFGAWQLRKRG